MSSVPVVARFSDCALRARRSPDQLAALAHQSLVAEVELTPKPGLVDRRGPGAHNDLSLELMLHSANVLEYHFALMGRAVAGLEMGYGMRKILAAIGRGTERAMFRATNGINSHKGAIWTLGLLVTAAAQLDRQSPEEVTSHARGIARLLEPSQPELVTHGDIVRSRYGVGGAREEAANGFPHILGHSLPVLRMRRAAGFPEEVGRLDALLSLIAALDDTCLLYRGGQEGLQIAKEGASAVLNAGGYATCKGRTQMRDLDRELARRRLSPGGSADLLAATILLDAVEREQEQVCADQSEWFDENEFVNKFKEDELEVAHGAA